MAGTDGVVTLDEQKAENEREEIEAAAAPQADVVEEDNLPADEELTKDPEDADPDESKEGESEVADWMKSDGHSSDEERKYTGADIGKAKYKATLKSERRYSAEIDGLKAEIEELKRKPVETKGLTEPRRDDFLDEDDPEDAFIIARNDYHFEKKQADLDTRAISEAENRKFEQQRQEIDDSVILHYDRIEKLATESKIKAEVFKQADLNVRQMIESVFPESGDLITDNFISKLGEGSEKVFFNLGVNKARRDQFEQILRTDTSGGKAWVFLGKLASDLTNSSKRKTTALDPAPKVAGDAAPQSMVNIEKDVSEAMAEGDMQKVLDLRAKAKASGVKLNRLA